MMSSDSKYIEYAKNEGYQIITIPDNLKDRVSSALDVKGNEIMDIEKYAVEWNENFEFDFVKSSQLSKSEKDIFALKETIMSWFPRTNKNVKEILISNVMRPDDYSGNDAAGLWIPSDRRIIIHRNQLKKVESFAGTLIHEIVHANTGTNDQTLAFENELTNALGRLAMLLVEENPQPTKKARGIFSIFK